MQLKRRGPAAGEGDSGCIRRSINGPCPGRKRPHPENKRYYSRQSVPKNENLPFMYPIDMQHHARCQHSHRRFASRQSKYTVTDRDGLQSTISLGHDQGRGMGGSLVLGESGKLCGRKIAGIRYRMTVTVGRMFKVVREMTEAPRAFAPVPLAVTGGRVQGMGFRGWI